MKVRTREGRSADSHARASRALNRLSALHTTSSFSPQSHSPISSLVSDFPFQDRLSSYDLQRKKYGLFCGLQSTERLQDSGSFLRWYTTYALGSTMGLEWAKKRRVRLGRARAARDNLLSMLRNLGIHSLWIFSSLLATDQTKSPYHVSTTSYFILSF